MQYLMLILLGVLLGQGMRRISMLRHLGQVRAARALYGRCCLWVAGMALCAMAGQLMLLAQAGMFHVGTALPLHLCSLMGVLLYPALRSGFRRLWQISLFLGVPGGLAALVFPAIVSSQTPALMAFCFFLLHCCLTLGPWLPLALGWRPGPGGAVCAFGFLLLHGSVAMTVNHLAGTNYLFLAGAPRGTPLAALAAGGQGAYVAALAGLAAVWIAAEGTVAWLCRRRWPERFPLSLDWREDLGRSRHMG